MGMGMGMGMNEWEKKGGQRLGWTKRGGSKTHPPSSSFLLLLFKLNRGGCLQGKKD
jgi:hypothetical protein